MTKKRLISKGIAPIRALPERWPSGRRRSPAKGVNLFSCTTATELIPFTFLVKNFVSEL